MRFSERLKVAIALAWWKMRGYHAPKEFRISADGIAARHLAIVLPPEFEDFDVARHALDALMKNVRAEKVTILVRENFRSWLAVSNAHVIPFNIEQKTWLGFPNADISRIAKQAGADVTLDLTPSFSIFTSSLAAATEAPLCIALNHIHAAKFFNVVVSPQSGRSLREQYQVLLSYL